MISGTITESELLEAYRFRRKRTDRFFYLSFVLIIVFGLLVAWRVDRTFGYILIGLGIFQMLFTFLLLHTLLPWRVRKTYRTMAVVRSPITWRWDAESVTLETAHSHLTRRWPEYRKTFENNQFFLLSIGGPFIQIIPKRWFQSEAQLNEFRKLAFAGRT
jgi:hypothetical protein